VQTFKSEKKVVFYRVLSGTADPKTVQDGTSLEHQSGMLDLSCSQKPFSDICTFICLNDFPREDFAGR
jgi:hypothetical protein